MSEEGTEILRVLLNNQLDTSSATLSYETRSDKRNKVRSESGNMIMSETNSKAGYAT